MSITTVITTVTPFSGPAPTRDDPTTFSARGDTTMTEMVAMVPDINTTVSEINAVADEMNDLSTAVSASEVAADLSADAAAAAAAAAAASVAGSANASGTSTTSTSIGLGSKTVTTQTGKNIPIGAFVQFARTSAASTTWMNGAVTAYNSGTGSLTFDSVLFSGSGTHTDWTLSISAPAVPTGLGGTLQASGDVILTVASSSVQSLTATKYGQSVKLPDATTLREGFQYNLAEKVDFSRKVLNSAGTLLGFIPGRTTLKADLADNTTAAGVWNITDMVPVAVTAEMSTLGLSQASPELKRVAIDANRTMLIAGATTSNLYAVVYDASTLTWGSVVLVRTTGGNKEALLCAADKVLVVSCDATTGMEGVVLSVTGTSIAVGTAATATLAGNLSQLADLITVGTSYVIMYTRATATTGFRGITVTGTTVAFGAESTMTGTAVGSGGHRAFAVSSTVFGTTSITNSTTVYVKCHSISGTTITPGTEINFTTDLADIRMVPWGTRWAIVHSNSSNIRVALISVAGTVPSATQATATMPTSSNNSTYVDAFVVGAKLVVTCNANSTTTYFNCYTDTSGTVSAGTPVSYATAGTPQSPPVPAVVSGNTVTTIHSSSGVNYRTVLDVSGVSPVIGYVSRGFKSGPTANASSLKGERRSTQLRSSDHMFVTNVGAGEPFTVVSANNITGANADNFNYLTSTTANSCLGADNEAWSCEYYSVGGLTFQRVECMQ